MRYEPSGSGTTGERTVVNGRIGSFGRPAALSAPSRADAPRMVLEAVLAAVLLVQGGRLVWSVVAPVPVENATSMSTIAATADPSVFQRFDAFFRTGAQSSLAEATGAEAAQMRLYGVRADADGGGSAIIGLPDGRQLSLAVGDEVEPGLVLKAVGADFVTLARGASLSRLIFTEIPAAAAAPPPPPGTPQVVRPGPAVGPMTPAGVAAPQRAVTPGGPAIDPRDLVQQAGLRPRMKGLRINGFAIGGQGGPALAATGLQPGDVVLSVNGAELNSLERIEELRGSLSDGSSAEIRYERGGQVLSTTIRTRP